MFNSWWYYLSIGALLVLVCLVAPSLLAARKGYSWYLWTIACGVLGLIILAFLPFANKPYAEEAANRSRRKTGNIIGAVLSAVGILSILYQISASASVMAKQIADKNASLSRFVEDLLTMSPKLVVEFLGMSLALVWWRRHPRISFFAALGFGLLFFTTVADLSLYAWLPNYLRDEKGWSFKQMSDLFRTIGQLSSFIGAPAFGSLVFAIFANRSHTGGAKQQSRIPDNPDELPEDREEGGA